MADLKKVISGTAIFLASFFGSIILFNFITYLTPVGDILQADYSSVDNTTIGGLAWLAFIIISLLGMIVIPTFLTIEGLRDEDKQQHPYAMMLAGVLIFIFGIMITVKGWYMLDALASATTENYILTLYWIGLLLAWAELIIITPAYLIIKGQTEASQAQ